jgi:hypothetical protein
LFLPGREAESSPHLPAVSVLGLHPDFVGIPLPALRARFPFFGTKQEEKTKIFFRLTSF